MSDHAPSHSQYLSQRYFAALDGLRCLSIVWVIGFHAQLNNPVWHRIFRRGDWGVGLFFAISGFLITTLLLREQSARGSVSLRNFYARRTLRIFPLYYAAVVLYTALVWKVERGPERSVYFRHLPYFLTYTGNWLVDRFAADRVIFAFSWTLATEEQFYLLWPSIIRFARNRSTPIYLISAALLFSTVMNALDAAGLLQLGETINRIATSIAPAICLGCILAYVLQSPIGYEKLRTILGRRWSAPLIFSGFIALYAILVYMPAKSVAEILLDAAMVPACVLVVGAVCFRQDNPLRMLLANAIVRYVGTISYGLYLLHMLALNAAKKILPPTGGLFLLLALSISVLMASASFWFFERQFLKLKSRFTSSTPNEPIKPELSPRLSKNSQFASPIAV